MLTVATAERHILVYDLNQPAQAYKVLPYYYHPLCTQFTLEDIDIASEMSNSLYHQLSE